ncbi:MAG: hypothetical protein B6D65_00055 [candidate division Zixibacteria bacterium 4484_93]|nr:MAG: hypothetical protein B6D65_00055 [candidate division Zixibacteria bacterium 4484_93]RKZ34131.1 MAG: hypothetical protein DRQ19_01630 [bacterium]
MKKIVLILAVVSLMVLAFGGCDTGKKGSLKPNLPPDVFWASIPPDSCTFGVAPIVAWYGTDRDGEVWYYHYVDIPLTGLPRSEYDGYRSNPQTIPDTLWTTVEATSDTILLSLEPTDTITEHSFFVKAEDNLGAESDIIFRTFYRTNQLPTVVLDNFYEDSETLFCLSATTPYWDGIVLTWHGEDPDNSIFFEYYWYIVDRDDPLDTVKRCDGWTRDENVVLTDVPTGSYFFYIKCRDDAFAESISPDSTYLNIVKPYYDITDSTVDPTTIPFKVLIVDESSRERAIFDIPSEETVNEFYTGIFDELVSRGVVDEYGYFECPDPEHTDLSKSLLAQYPCIYWHNADASTKRIGTYMMAQIEKYLNSGGSLLLEGRKPIIDLFGSSTGATFAMNYLGVDQFHRAIETWQNSRDAYAFASAVPSNEDYSELTVNVAMVDSVFPNDIVAGIPETDFIGSYEGTSGGVEYTEILYRIAVSPEVASDTAYADEYQYYNNRPIAVRHSSTNFRAALFNFSMFYMDNSTGAVTDAIATTLSWIEEGMRRERTGED